jgi:hypothetical protein
LIEWLRCFEFGLGGESVSGLRDEAAEGHAERAVEESGGGVVLIFSVRVSGPRFSAGKIFTGCCGGFFFVDKKFWRKKKAFPIRAGVFAVSFESGPFTLAEKLSVGSDF